MTIALFFILNIINAAISLMLMVYLTRGLISSRYRNQFTLHHLVLLLNILLYITLAYYTGIAGHLDASHAFGIACLIGGLFIAFHFIGKKNASNLTPMVLLVNGIWILDFVLYIVYRAI